jgi:hypothetical protein
MFLTDDQLYEKYYKLHNDVFTIVDTDDKEEREQKLNDLVTFGNMYRNRLSRTQWYSIYHHLVNFRTFNFVCERLLNRYYSTYKCNLFLESKSRKCLVNISKKDITTRQEKYCHMHRPFIFIVKTELSTNLLENLSNVVISYL